MQSSDAIWGKIKKGVFVVAEAGKNFIQTEDERLVEEYLENAKKLVDAAALAGADAIKFQVHNVEDEQLNIHVMSPHFSGSDRYQWVRRNTLATPVDRFWEPLKKYCDEVGIIIFVTPMSRGGAQRISELNMPLWKIGSADILDFVCMDYLRNTDAPIIMSSGMSTLEEIKLGFNFLREKNDRVALVHALSKYPGLPEEANLATIQLFQELFPDAPIGFSENSLDIEVSLVAVALGAKIIEKHITLSRESWGPDHKVSSLPEEFKTLVEAIRKLEATPTEKDKWLHRPDIKAILGRKEKVLQEDEADFRPLFRKALVAGSDIEAGTNIGKEMIYATRPQKFINGLSSDSYPKILGKKILVGIKKYEPFKAEHFNI